MNLEIKGTFVEEGKIERGQVGIWREFHWNSHGYSSHTFWQLANAALSFTVEKMETFSDWDA